MNLHGIDLNLLVAFDALMSERSVTRAGARIGRTQPAMSAALARLRLLTKDELFVRGRDGLQPTPRAVDLAAPVSFALREIQQALDSGQPFDASLSGVVLNIGLSEHPSHRLLPSLVTAIEREAPGISLRLRHFTAREDGVHLLDSGEIHIAVGIPLHDSARFLACPLFHERFVCVMRKDHPAAQGPLTIERFLQLSHLLVSPENEHFGVVDTALARRGLKRRLGLILPQLYVAPAIVAASDLVATLMEGVVSASGKRDELVILDPPVELDPVLFVMTWHRRNDAHPALRWLRAIVSGLATS